MARRLCKVIRINNNNDVPVIIPIYLMIIKMFFDIVWIISVDVGVVIIERDV